MMYVCLDHTGHYYGPVCALFLDETDIKHMEIQVHQNINYKLQSSGLCTYEIQNQI